MKNYKVRSIFLFLVLFIACISASAVHAAEIRPYSTHIGYLGTSLVTSGTCLKGTISGSYSGEGLHAIFYSEFQYQTAGGGFTAIGDSRTFRSYSQGIATFDTYYCNPTPGVKYRFHTTVKVVDGSGDVWDSDVINSETLVY